MEDTTIQWCDYTFNPWSGCTKVNAGCSNCYAEVNYSVKVRGVRWGPNGNRIRASDSMWKTPLKWERAAAKALQDMRHDPVFFDEPVARPRVFCASLADVFEDWQGPIVDSKGCGIYWSGNRMVSSIFKPTGNKISGEMATAFKWVTMDDLRADLFKLIDATPYLDWMLLTKRPQNIHRMWPIAGNGKDAGAIDYARRDNVWLGCSVSDQPTADVAISHLLRCRDLAPVLFVSYEPALGPVDFGCWIPSPDGFVAPFGGGAWHVDDGAPSLDLIIAGGESGPNARPCNIDWIRSTINQCEEADVACFVKQLGESCSGQPVLKDKKGGDMSEWPEDLRVRQMPEVFSAND